MQVEFTNEQTVHEGRLYKAGDTAQMSEDQAALLIKAGVIKEPAKKEAKPKG